MKMKKTGKQFSITTKDGFNIKYGSINNYNPKSIFFKITSWVTLNNAEKDYKLVINNLIKKIKKDLYSYIDNKNLPYNKNYSIIDLDIRVSGLQKNKKTFMDCEITLFTTQDLIVNDINSKKQIENIIKHLLSQSFNTDKNFKYHNKKNCLVN